MTARQIIQEIEALPAEEQREVFVLLQERLENNESSVGEIAYVDQDKAMHIAERIFTERAELFQKLAQ